MRKLPFIKSAGILMIALASACATPYFGKTFTPTQNVDMYLDAADVKKTYEVMGTSDVDQGFSSLNALQQKVIELGKTKGADGVIMKLTEEVTGSTKNDFGTTDKGKQNNTYSSSSITTNTKVKKVQATFIKYK
ncbi:hypothetical protein [Pedobacter caeni]|uniref:DUF4156 domain-containing protein n=1 Tax=Pedobacter caeni TaxID=288992 RepID=A0A1M4TUA9_9SPHI|nr:hypothetical protein [Pedobacter caeni]SHE48070.1 hypothetical protein SAMN04488522_101323 [Pedobacter caeni]